MVKFEKKKQIRTPNETWCILQIFVNTFWLVLNVLNCVFEFVQIIE